MASHVVSRELTFIELEERFNQYYKNLELCMKYKEQIFSDPARMAQCKGLYAGLETTHQAMQRVFANSPPIAQLEAFYQTLCTTHWAMHYSLDQAVLTALQAIDQHVEGVKYAYSTLEKRMEESRQIYNARILEPPRPAEATPREEGPVHVIEEEFHR